MNVKRENFKDAYPEFFELTVKHWEECGEINGGSSLNLAYNDLCRASDMGYYICYVARKFDGTPIGYATYTVNHGVHSCNDTYAVTDSVYIAPEFRKGLSRYGLKLLKTAELDLKRTYKVDVIQFAMNCTYDISNMLMRMGYSPAEVLFNKKVN